MDALQPDRNNSESSQRPSLAGQPKKKSFTFSLFKSSRDEAKSSGTFSSMYSWLHTNTSLTKKPDDLECDDKVAQKKGKGLKRASGNNMTNIDIWADADAGGRQIEVQQNWLARLFRVKPAMRNICFCVPKRKCQAEIVKLLLSWQEFGIEDIEVDEERDLVFARVGATNGKLTNISHRTVKFYVRQS